jgi:membrane fusion protein, multidrug efflux system
MNSVQKQPGTPGPGIGGQSPAVNGGGDQPIDDVPMFKRKRVIVPLLIAVLVVVAGGWYWYAHTYSFIGTDDAFIDANRCTISSKLMGRISRLGADEGDTVRQGDTLVALDNSDLMSQLAKAEASVRYYTRSAEISAVNLEKAKDDFSRTEKQFKGGIATQEQFNHAQNALKLAEAQADMAQSQITTAQADHNIIETQLGNCFVTAPFTGVVAKRWVMQGEVVQPGQAVFSAYDVKNVWVNANYEETKLRKIRPGMRVDVALDAFPGHVLPGRVLWIGKTTASQFSLIPASNASGNFTKITQRVPVKIAVAAPPSGAGVSLLPGLSATVHIFTR